VLRHRTVAGSDLQEVLPDTPGAEGGALGLLEQAAARAALRGLPERQREAIVLRYYAGLSEGEIAAAMGHQPGRCEESHRPRVVRASFSSPTGQLATCPSPRQ
jgi:DNA-directed RNA polymerase specialized sigma24 family protein